MLGYRKPMSIISHFSLFLLLFFFLSARSDHDHDHDHAHEHGHGHRHGVKLNMMHRHHPKVSKKIHGHVKVQGIDDRIKDMHERDIQRHRTISAALNLFKETAAPEAPASSGTQFRRQSGPPIGLKIISGFDLGNSEYFVTMRVGTPPQKFMVVADTGSDLTWLNCRYRRCQGNCTVNPRRSRNERKFKFKSKVFLANQSSSFKYYNCSSSKCQNEFSPLFSIAECPTPGSPCLYEYTYSGGVSASGFFASDTLTVSLTNGKESKLENSLVGCTESVNREIIGSDGIIGLGTNYYSFTSKVGPTAGGGISYCLVDHLSNSSAVSYMVLGPPGSPTPTGNFTTTGKMNVTKLLVGGLFNNFYGVSLVGLSVNGNMLNIPSRVWDIKTGGGTILDSGTSLALFSAPAYDAVVHALRDSLSGAPRVECKPFQYCIDSTNFDLSKVPQLGFHFADGAVFNPPRKSYIIVAGYTTLCIGFISLPFPSNNIIGNVLQQSHLWQYDFYGETVGFAPSECV